jgi:hypothetical protein
LSGMGMGGGSMCSGSKTKGAFMKEETCACPCHTHPGTYFAEPCSVCAHYNSQGEWQGSLYHGYWMKTRYTHDEILKDAEKRMERRRNS